MTDELEPKEFEVTAKAATEACQNAANAHDRAVLLAEAGLLGVLAPEDVGGLDLPLRFAVPVAAAAGGGLLGFPLIEAMVLAKALASIADDVAGAICSGESVATIAWKGVLEDGAASAVPMGMDADQVLIFRKDGGAVLVSADKLQREPADQWDLEVPSAALRWSGPLTGIEIDAETAGNLRSEANILRGATIQGSAAQCLALAVDYAQQRVQFGKPLSANQALRHRMSRDALAVETMRSGLIRALAAKGAHVLIAREAAWLNAARSGPVVAESAIQVFGGMGFTWEVPLHRHLRQMRALSGHGAAADGIEALGQAILTGASNSWYEDMSNGQ